MVIIWWINYIGKTTGPTCDRWEIYGTKSNKACGDVTDDFSSSLFVTLDAGRHFAIFQIVREGIP